MNEDAKKKLNEKLGAAVTDEQLEKVAGGTYEQNLEILNAMARLDFEGVQSIFAKVNASDEDEAQEIICQGAEDLLEKHFGGLGIASITATNVDNWYRTGRKVWENIPHEQMLKMINNKANAARG